MNRVELIGRTTKELELRHTRSGTASCSFTLAVDGYPNKDGEKTTDFIPCLAWGKQAEAIQRFVRKGQRLGISGRIRTGSYEKDGRTIYTTDVIVEQMDFIEPKREECPQTTTEEELPF